MSLGPQDLSLGSTGAAPSFPAPPPKLALRFQPHLYAGERLVWAVRPRTPFNMSDFVASGTHMVIAMGLAGAAFAWWELSSPLWAVAVLAATLAAALGVYWIAPPASSIGRQFYALTDRRALILQDPPNEVQMGAQRSSVIDSMVEELISIDLAKLATVTPATGPARLEFKPPPVHEPFRRRGMDTPHAFVGLGRRRPQILRLIENLRREAAHRI